MRKWSLVLLLALPDQVEAGVKYKVASSALHEEIQARGVRPVLWELTSDEVAWNKVLSGIRSGKRDWLGLAVELYRGSDVRTSEVLTGAVRDALEVQAENVLSMAMEEFPLAAVCGLPDADTPRFPTLEAALSAIGARQAKLRAITDASLGAVRDKCLARLESAKEPLRQGFARR